MPRLTGALHNLSDKTCVEILHHVTGRCTEERTDISGHSGKVPNTCPIRPTAGSLLNVLQCWLTLTWPVGGHDHLNLSQVFEAVQLVEQLHQCALDFPVKQK